MFILLIQPTCVDAPLIQLTCIYGMLINIICAPPDAPQISTAPFQPALQPKLDRLDMRIVETVREFGLTKIWAVLNALADDEAPRNRAEGRNLRLHLLAKLRRLNRLGLVFFVGRNLVSPEKPDPETALAASRRRGRSVRKSSVFRAVSAGSSLNCPKQQSATHPVQGTGDGSKNKSTGPVREAKKTKSAPDPAEVVLAARALAQIPRKQKRKWSGYMDGERIWRDRKIVLPDGSVVYVYGARRGQGVYFRDLSRELEPGRWGAFKTSEVKLWKNPAAVALGSRKRGRKERRSSKKILAARANGRKPCRKGRTRGRPRRSQTRTETIASSNSTGSSTG